MPFYINLLQQKAKFPPREISSTFPVRQEPAQKHRQVELLLLLPRGLATKGSSHQGAVLAARHVEVLLHLTPKFLMETNTKLMYNTVNRECTIYSEIPEHSCSDVTCRKLTADYTNMSQDVLRKLLRKSSFQNCCSWITTFGDFLECRLSGDLLVFKDFWFSFLLQTRLSKHLKDVAVRHVTGTFDQVHSLPLCTPVPACFWLETPLWYSPCTVSNCFSPRSCFLASHNSAWNPDLWKVTRSVLLGGEHQPHTYVNI